MNRETQQKIEIVPLEAYIQAGWKGYVSRFSVLSAIVAIPATCIILGYLVGVFVFRDVGYIILGLAFVIFALSFFALIGAARDGSMGVRGAYLFAIKNFSSLIWIGLLFFSVEFGGFVMGIIPASIFAIWFAFSPYVFATEGDQGFSALLKSREYVRGFWWSCFWRLSIASAIGAMINLILVLLTTGIVVIVGSNAEWPSMMVRYAASVFFSPIYVVFTWSLYSDLTQRKSELVGKQVVGKKGFLIFATILGSVVAVALLAILLLLIFPPSLR